MSPARTLARRPRTLRPHTLRPHTLCRLTLRRFTSLRRMPHGQIPRRRTPLLRTLHRPLQAARRLPRALAQDSKDPPTAIPMALSTKSVLA